MEATLTIREGALFCSTSSSKLVRRKYPRWLIANVLSIPSSVIERSRKGRAKEIDIRRFAKAYEFLGTNGTSELRLTLEITNSGSARPEEIFGSIYRLDEAERRALSSRVRRCRLFVWREGTESSPLEAAEASA